MSQTEVKCIKYSCDRCATTAMQQEFCELPTGWAVLKLADKKLDLCYTCTDSFEDWLKESPL